MRPPILTKYRVDELVTNLKDSKDAIVWVTRFIPQILNKQKIHANAISLVKRISLFKKQPINEDDIKKLQNHFKEIGRDDLACVRETDNRKENVLIFCKHDDAPETIDGIERHIYRIIPNAKLKFGVSDINRDRCSIVKKKTWNTEKDRPSGVYSIADLSSID
jgi:hypothetical protein|tara:strand:- start:1353 stop:1841 length:489 start_codon:yes stop_codon:yes gene_type:complete